MLICSTHLCNLNNQDSCNAVGRLRLHRQGYREREPVHMLKKVNLVNGGSICSRTLGEVIISTRRGNKWSQRLGLLVDVFLEHVHYTYSFRLLLNNIKRRSSKNLQVLGKGSIFLVFSIATRQDPTDTGDLVMPESP